MAAAELRQAGSLTHYLRGLKDQEFRTVLDNLKFTFGTQDNILTKNSKLEIRQPAPSGSRIAGVLYYWREIRNLAYRRCASRVSEERTVLRLASYVRDVRTVWR